MSHLVKKDDLQDYIQSLAVKRGCPVDNIDKTKAHWDLIINRKTCLEVIRVYKGLGVTELRVTVDEIKWECDICGKKLTSRSSRDRHKRTVHKPK